MEKKEAWMCGDEQEETNELYGLLDAGELGNGLTFEESLGGIPFAEDFEDDEGGFRNASGTFSESMLEGDVYSSDVYRSVAGVDLGSQHQMGTFGELHLDQPFEFQALRSALTTSNLNEPAPRVFTKLNLEHTHLYAFAPLEKLVETLNGLYREHQVDFTFDHEGCFWRGMMYPKSPVSPAVDFRAYINSCPEVGTNRYLIEFVRRSGCNMTFFELFTSIMRTLIDKKMVTLQNGDSVHSIDDIPRTFLAADVCWENKVEESLDGDSLPRPVFSRASSLSSQLENLTDDFAEVNIQCTDEELFRPLVEMSRSKFEDVHVQGLSLVAHETAKGNAKRLVDAVPSIVELLCERIEKTSSREVRRHSCSALCAMGSEQALHPALISNNVPQILASLAATEFDPAMAEIQRLAAQGLANMCTLPESIKAVFEAVKDKNDTFTQLAQCNDSRLNESIAAVRKALASC
mmetsp:Transcript_10769/g.17646  ORF Transcript_10769/g.17646 Transcript_10769/m.17646 type:complete len:462 (+) Transcript_10769:462-1847(+)|eukprot:CAMPEP_0203747624 /NCGR_PEP_ID=MMETSP0098-20131031/2710_1 /ASSEMBLY_ACC=CAM_ASM_000208 /TAXON_ID=96639 /ORGANISM=" , Strain NY0313808BC1" /LENGTH=461 /DNA_ID=CAMNT_0050636091 /DNA_START=528 /DNA_END=1913 /DNA_ORIENTATION=+